MGNFLGSAGRNNRLNFEHIKRTSNMQLTFVIRQQLTYKNMSNSVHNCESRSRMNYQGDRLID